MEEARYWMWAKTTPDPILLAAMSDSWEEQAFAIDAAGALGGCVWPPRYYSCSFCRREFRSAQALGGHMNVHRRERARLKQSPNISSSTDQVAASFTSQISSLLFKNPSPEISESDQVAASFTSQISSLLFKNPSPEISDTLVPDTRNINIRDQSPPATKDTSALCFFSPIFQQNFTNTRVSSTHPSWSSFVMDKKDHALDPIKNQEKKKSAFIIEPNSREDWSTLDLSVSLDLEVCRTDMNGSNDEEAGGKRRRIDSKPSSFLQQSSKKGRLQTDVFKLYSSSVEELDLELRLGDAPKVK